MKKLSGIYQIRLKEIGLMLLALGMLTGCDMLFSKRKRPVMQTCKAGEKKVAGKCVTPDSDDLTRRQPPARPSANTWGDTPDYSRGGEREGGVIPATEPPPVTPDPVSDRDQSAQAGSLDDWSRTISTWQVDDGGGYPGSGTKSVELGLWLGQPQASGGSFVAMMQFKKGEKPDVSKISYVYGQKKLTDPIQINANGLLSQEIKIDVEVLFMLREGDESYRCKTDKVSLGGNHLYLPDAAGNLLNNPLVTEAKCKRG